VSARGWSPGQSGPADCRRKVAAPVRTADRPALAARRKPTARLTPATLRLREAAIQRTLMFRWRESSGSGSEERPVSGGFSLRRLPGPRIRRCYLEFDRGSLPDKTRAGQFRDRSGSDQGNHDVDVAPKQAGQPAANSCSGLVPLPAVPGVESLMSRRPSELRDAPPSRPPSCGLWRCTALFRSFRLSWWIPC